MVAAFGPCRSTISFRFLPSITKMSPTRTVPCVASYAGMDITVHASDKRRAAGHRSRRVTARVALGAVRSVPGREAQDEPRPRLLPPSRRPTGRQPRPARRDAQTAQTQLPHATRARRRGVRARLRRPLLPCAQRPNVTDAPRPAPDILLPPRSRGRPRKTERPQRFTQREQHPINHHVTGRRTAGRGPR